MTGTTIFWLASPADGGAVVAEVVSADSAFALAATPASGGVEGDADAAGGDPAVGDWRLSGARGKEDVGMDGDRGSEVEVVAAAWPAT